MGVKIIPDLSYDVLCIGVLVADIFVPPLNRFPASGELMLVDDLLLSTGGCAANTGMDLAKLGARVSVTGKVGNDVFADFILHELQSKCIDVSGIRYSSTAPTSRTVILPIIGDDRRYIHSVGANAELKVSDVDLDQVARARVLYVGGYMVIPGFKQEELMELFMFAKVHGIKTVLDVAGVNPRLGLEPLRQVLPYTDVFLPNDDEGFLITRESDPLKQTEIFVEGGVTTAVVTLGGRGAVARTRQQCLHAPAFQIDFVDASGGGDAFDAGFIIGLLEGWDLLRTLEFASAIGASACTRLGTTAGVFTRTEADVFLAEHHLKITTI
jgi:sugar/nucleoside kinase (ribokinase family)